MAYKAKLDFFEGQLDFLLYLVEEGIIPPGEIPVGDVLRGYLADLEGEDEGEEEGQSLTHSAALIWRKARALVDPRSGGETKEPGEETPVGEEVVVAANLAARLAVYGKVKVAADFLARQAEEERQRFWRLVTAEASGSSIPKGTSGFSPGVLWDALQRLQERESRAVKVPSPLELTVGEVMTSIVEVIGRGTLGGGVPLEYFAVPGGRLSQYIVLFLAVLELIRRGEIMVEQRGPFGEIILQKGGAEGNEN